MKKIRFIIVVFTTVLLVFLSSCNKKDKHTHEWINATCTTPKTCKICNITEGSALGHALIGEDIHLDPTCTEDGYSNHFVCSRCDYDYYEIVKTSGHDLVHHDRKDATCTEAGYEAYDTCKNCDYTTFKEIDALDHDWIEASKDSPKKCRRCGETDGEAVKPTFNAKLAPDYVSLGSRGRILVDGYYDLENFDIELSNDFIEVDSFGVITTKKIGTTTIKISLKSDPTDYMTLEFEVISKQPQIYLTYTKMELNDVTSIFFKNLDELLEDSIEDFNITFKNGGIFELTTDYRLKAVKYGYETVIFTSKRDDRIKATVDLTVGNKASFLIIYGKDDNGIVKAGEQFEMTVASGYSNKDLEWASLDTSVAVVSDAGIVTVKSEGYTIITAHDPKNPYDQTKITNYYITVKGEVEVDYLSRFIHTALRENGVCEEGENRQKYGKWYPNNGQPWCAMFVSWCWYQAGLSTDILCKYQSCTAGMKWCTEQDIMHYVQDFTFGEDLANGKSRYQKGTTYQPVTGDIVFFLSSGMSHTGIVIYADSTYLYTIEGNTSDKVEIKRWSLKDARITGYAHPAYPEYSGVREDFSWIKDKKEDGTYWWRNVAEKEKTD